MKDGGVGIFSIYRHHTQTKINIFGLRLTIRNARIPFYKYICNRENAITQKDNINKITTNAPDGRKNFLMVIDSVIGKGGVETRILQYAKLLVEHGYNVYFLTEEPLVLPDFSRYARLQLNFYADNFSEYLQELIILMGKTIIEFQFKADGYLHFVDINALRRHAKIGCVLHGGAVHDWERISHFDYRVTISICMFNIYKEYLNDIKVVKNSCKKPRVQWQYSEQRTALSVSRLSSDKYAMLETFVSYCLARNIDFEIAGGEDEDYDLKARIIRKFGISSDIFIGEIETTQYLSDNAGKYLFVAGVGLVAIEAGMLNYPVFVPAPDGEGHSTFLTKDNYNYFTSTNFTVFTRLNNWLDKTNTRKLHLDTARVDQYSLGREFLRDRNIEDVFEDYERIVEGAAD